MIEIWACDICGETFEFEVLDDSSSRRKLRIVDTERLRAHDALHPKGYGWIMVGRRDEKGSSLAKIGQG